MSHIPIKQTPKTYIFVDGSYFCFHRFHSTLNLWKTSHPENPILENPIENEEFVEKFKNNFIKTFQNIPLNLGLCESIDNPIMFVGRDCKRKDIWRMSILNEYKGTRNKKHSIGVGDFFKLVYEEKLFEVGGAKDIFAHPKLEADDCIALCVNYLLEKDDRNNDINGENGCRIFIITSDKDYLQLAEPRVKIFDLSFKNLEDQKSSFGDAKANLFCKIVMGDISDNIKSVLKKCGPKTVKKYFLNKELFEEALKNEQAYDRYKQNTTLVDFAMIPQEYINEFLLTVIL